ncbi:MAG TPA: hypothetical protein VMF03_05165 [Steroidobacteraceae bacterium]|nr:hypothetical protein [Steroidobacteraceae bacterium]
MRAAGPGTAVALLTLATAAWSAGPPQALPDWSGVWKVQGSMALISTETGRTFVPGEHDQPPLRPQFEQQYTADRRRAEQQGDPNAKDPLTDTNTLHCFPGMPRAIATPFTYEFVITPRKTWIILDKVVRQIFTDGRNWPPADARWPLMLGRSRGHWHDGELTIETVDMRDDMWADTTPLMFSHQAQVTERIHQVDANTLENHVVIHDPVRLTHDWEFTRRYVRTANDWPDDPELCGGPDDRNPVINGRVTVKLPQDAKP